MDVTSVANMATQMKQTELKTQMSVEMLKKSQDVQKMMGAGALELINSAGADAAAMAQGRGLMVNLTA